MLLKTAYGTNTITNDACNTPAIVRGLLGIRKFMKINLRSEKKLNIAVIPQLKLICLPSYSVATNYRPDFTVIISPLSPCGPGP